MSDLQSALEYFQWTDYTAVAVFTAVTYDYLLTFSREVEYIWKRPWTWVSTMFVVVRYIGLSWVILTNLFGTTFMPGPVEYSKGIVTNLVYTWEFPIFLAAADMVMILRVYAMWGRSRTILYILLFLFVPQVIVSLVFSGIFSRPNVYYSVETVQVLNFTVCDITPYNIPFLLETHLIDGVLRFVVSAMLLILAVFQTLRQSYVMYTATKQWQVNQYMQQIAGDGIIYFCANVFTSINLIVQNQLNLSISATFLLQVFAFATITPLMPRFIISMRELYERDSRGNMQKVDTAFGAVLDPITTSDTLVSAIAFADRNPAQEEDQVVEGDAARDSEDIQLVALKEGTQRV